MVWLPLQNENRVALLVHGSLDYFLLEGDALG